MTHEIKQGSPEWHAMRLGCITASEADCLLVDGAKKKKPNLLLPDEFGAGAETYAMKLLNELLTMLPSDSGTSWEMEFGHEYEDEARSRLTEVLGLTAEQITTPAFILHPELSLIGCSPDALIDSKDVRAGAEIKCRCSEAHTRLLMEDLVASRTGDRAEVPDANVAQVQFSLWVTQAELWYYVSFAPAHDESTDLIVLEVERNEPMIKKLERRATIMRECILAAYEQFMGDTNFVVDEARCQRLARWVESKPFEKLGMLHKEIRS